jgi:transcriptional regulator with XRE-family HTH domain
MAKKPKKSGPVQAFGVSVRSIREKLEISQEELWFRSELHRTFVSDIERGARNPTIQTVWKLAQGLEVQPSEIIKIAESK